MVNISQLMHYLIQQILNFPALRGRGFANQKIYFGILLPRRPSEF